MPGGVAGPESEFSRPPTALGHGPEDVCRDPSPLGLCAQNGSLGSRCRACRHLLRWTYGQNVQYILFLCRYFDSGYLGYEAAEGIDWVWEHRIEDFKEFGL